MKLNGMIKWPNGDKAWYLNNELHREDGPAIEWVNGDKAWYLNGEHHRGDGLPAIEYANGDKRWFLNGKPVTQNEVEWNAIKDLFVL